MLRRRCTSEEEVLCGFYMELLWTVTVTLHDPTAGALFRRSRVSDKEQPLSSNAQSFAPTARYITSKSSIPWIDVRCWSDSSIRDVTRHAPR